MPGFSKSARPRQNGVFINYETDEPTQIAPVQGSVVAVPYVHTWGPFKQAKLYSSWAAWLADNGEDTSPGQVAVQQAFRGEGVLNRGGAGGVLAYRMGGSAAAKATHNFGNITPAANAITITALYEGSRGNDLNVTIQDSATGAANTDLIVYDGAVELERYVFPDADIAEMAATVNATSRWIRITVTIDNVGLALATSTALTGGNDGSTLLGSDYTAMEAAYVTESFGVFAPSNLTDDTIRTALVSWSKSQNALGKRHTLVVGGALNEGAAAAISRSKAINDPNIVNLGVGGAIDDELGTLSPAQLVPRLAGVIAARGETKSFSMARMAGLTSIVGGATPTEIGQCFDAGVVVLNRDSYTPAPVHIEKALTTYSVEVDPKIPVRVFSNPKWVRTMQGIDNETQQLGASPGGLGELPVNDKTRNFFKGEVTAQILEPRVTNTAIQPGYTIDVDVDPPPSDDDEFIAYRIGLRWGRVAEQVFFTVKAG